MADAHKKEDGHAHKDDKHDKPKEHAEKEGLSKGEFLVDVVTGMFGHKVGDALIKGSIDFFGDKAKHAVTEKPRQLISFGEALTKLRQVDSYSFDVINDFMRVELTADHDRDDFQVRTAKMGGDNVDVTVAFLQLVAAENDHSSRREFLDAMGVIGERALDPYEKAKLMGKKALNFVKTRGVTPLDWIKADLNGAFATLNTAAEADNVRLRAEIARRTATPPVPAPTGNRFVRAFNALRGK